MVQNSLATTTSILAPLEYFEANRFSIELLYRISLPDNIMNCRSFEGDEKIIEFIIHKATFNDVEIHGKEHRKNIIKL